MEGSLFYLVILVAIFICIQVATMLGILVILRKLGGNLNCIQALVEQEAKPAVSEVREAIGEAKEVIKIARGAAENLTGVTDTVRLQVEHVNSIIQETTDKAKVQISRADEVITEAIEKIETTSTNIQQNILTPIQELSRVIQSISSGLNVFFGRRKNPVDKAHQDEEMFI